MITKAALLEDLDRAGIDPHGMLLCHFSMKKIGPVENGADTVLDALMEYMKNGLLIVPCHTWSNVNDENPVFDVRETKPCVGLLPDLFRRRKGVVRTLHPTHSLCVYGPRAQAFAEGQERFDTPCAPADKTEIFIRYVPGIRPQSSRPEFFFSRHIFRGKFLRQRPVIYFRHFRIRIQFPYSFFAAEDMGSAQVCIHAVRPEWIF